MLKWIYGILILFYSLVLVGIFYGLIQSAGAHSKWFIFLYILIPLLAIYLITNFIIIFKKVEFDKLSKVITWINFVLCISEIIFIVSLILYAKITPSYGDSGGFLGALFLSLILVSLVILSVIVLIHLITNIIVLIKNR